MRKLVQGGTVVTATHSSQADVLIDGEEIVAVGSLGDVDAEVIDATGCYVLPGLIDNHTHMAMPFGGTARSTTTTPARAPPRPAAPPASSTS